LAPYSIIVACEQAVVSLGENEYGLEYLTLCAIGQPMKSSRRKLLGLVILLVLFLPLAISVVEAYREVHQQALNHGLIAAIKKNDTPTVISLLSKGADPNAKDFPPDTRSAWQRICDSLRRKRIQPAHASTALLVALAMRLDLDIKSLTLFPPENVPLVKALLDAGANVNVADEYGNTPLIWAAVAMKRTTARLLLDRGAKIMSRSIDGATALYCAATQGDPSLIQMLLARGAQVNVPGIGGESPLAKAVSSRKIISVRLLLNSGAEVNARSADGGTPLSRAVVVGRADCVKLLLARGAQVNTKDNEGDTPLILAQGNPKIVTLLKKAGAKK